MKKIPQGAEASNIMVGEVEFLNHPITAFVRLSKSVLLADLTEVPVPTRFLYILLGPVGNAGKYHEIGRSIATLMSDEVLECFLFGLFLVYFIFKLEWGLTHRPFSFRNCILCSVRITETDTEAVFQISFCSDTT